MAGNFLWQFMIFDYDFKNDINFKIITKTADPEKRALRSHSQKVKN